jgi:hypothetical protein
MQARTGSRTSPYTCLHPILLSQEIRGEDQEIRGEVQARLGPKRKQAVRKISKE